MQDGAGSAPRSPFLLEVAMLARALSCAVVGLDSALVEVEVDLSQGLPAFTIECRQLAL